MVKLVLSHKANSKYEDEPDVVYDFPRRYLKDVRDGIGDWIVYYEPVKAGRRGYFAAAKLQQVIPKPDAEGRYLAIIEPNSFLQFDRDVPRQFDGITMETAFANSDGTLKRGGKVQSSVRRLSESDFARIIDLGLPEDLEKLEANRYAAAPVAFDEPQTLFKRPVVERLTRRPFREVAFRRKVREVYDYRCAMSGLQLRNGGGRPEVNAAHIRPVEKAGSDSVRNGLALSGTLHWMFDRGLISVADDCETILVSHNKVPGDVVDRLLRPSRKLWRPADERFAPHPDNLRWHRENVFGQVLGDAALDWTV